MSGETCGTCFHWKEAEKDLGECRNTSPSVVPTAIEKVAESENNSRKKYHAVFKLMTLCLVLTAVKLRAAHMHQRSN